MMERKLIKQGGGGYTIYLPKQWIEKKSLKEGDSVKISESNTSLIIDSEIKENKQITITITDQNKKDLRVLLTHLYRKGYNSIFINGADPNLLKQVNSIAKDFLLGFEITEKTEKSCKLENISEPTEQKYNIIMKKIFFLLEEFNSLVLGGLNDYRNHEETVDLRKNIDKFILFCRRILIKEKNEKDPVFEWELLTFLTHIGHSYFYAYDYAKENKLYVNKNIISLFEKLKSYFGLLEDAYFEKDIEKVHKINLLKDKYHFGEVVRLMEKAKGKESIFLSYIKDIFRLIQLGSSPVLLGLMDEKDYMSISAS